MGNVWNPGDRDSWKRANDVPAVIRTQSFNGNEQDSESVWFVAVQGHEFNIKLTLDDAETLGRNLIERAAELRRELT